MRLRRLVPQRSDLRVLLGYIVAAAVYVVIGVLVTDFLLSFFAGIAYLLVVAWLVPAAMRRLL